MRYKKELGVSIVNVVLIIFIIILCGVIFYIIKPEEKNELIAEVTNEIVITNENHTIPNTIVEDTTEDVRLDENVFKQNTNQTQVAEPSTSSKYYYNQLDEDGKTIYNAIKNNISALKDGNSEISIGEFQREIGSKFQGAWDAFSLDYPELFYVETNNISLLTKTITFWGSTKYNYSIQPKNGKYYTSAWNSAQQVEDAIKQVETKVNYILDQTSLYSTRYDKIKCVHDYLIENCEYDKEEINNRSNIYGTLVNGRAICEGYADSFNYVMNKLNIPCVTVCGNAYSSDGSGEFHAWNYVQMEDGNWYAVDVTWDDPIIIGSGSVSSDVRYRYFLVGGNTFFSSHHEDGDVSGTGQNFIYPTISNEDY